MRRIQKYVTLCYLPYKIWCWIIDTKWRPKQSLSNLVLVVAKVEKWESIVWRMKGQWENGQISRPFVHAWDAFVALPGATQLEWSVQSYAFINFIIYRLQLLYNTFVATRDTFFFLHFFIRIKKCANLPLRKLWWYS